jgi:hypothetical protein
MEGPHERIDPRPAAHQPPHPQRKEGPMIQPTCEQARRSSLFPTFDVEGAPFDGVLPRRFHAHTNTRRAGRGAATFTRAAPGRFPTWGVAPVGPPSSSTHHGRVPPSMRDRRVSRRGPGVPVECNGRPRSPRSGSAGPVIYPDASSMKSRGPRRLNQMVGRPKEAMTGHERASTTS